MARAWTWPTVCMALGVLGLCTRVGAGGRGPAPPTPGTAPCVTSAVPAATHEESTDNTPPRMANTDPLVDAIGMTNAYALPAGPEAARGMVQTMAYLARLSAPLVLETTDGGAYALRGVPGSSGPRTVRLDSDQLAALRRFASGHQRAGAPAAGPHIRTSIQWDPGTGAYDLMRIEFGLSGRSVWIVFEQGDRDSSPGNISIRFMREW